MEQLLRLEADNPFQVTIEAVRKQIDGLESIETLVKKIQFIGSSPGNYFRDHPAVRAVQEEWRDVAEYKSEYRVRELIESAKASGGGREKMIACPLPADPTTEDDRPILVPARPRTPIQRQYIETAIKYAEGMREWWLEKETARMKKELEED